MYLLSALSTGFVRGIYIDCLDKLSEGIRGQFRESAAPLYPLNKLLYILCLLFLFMDFLQVVLVNTIMIKDNRAPPVRPSRCETWNRRASCATP